MVWISWQSGSATLPHCHTWQCEQQCAAVQQCAPVQSAVCSSDVHGGVRAVCVAVHTAVCGCPAVRQCAAVQQCGSVRKCEQRYAAVRT
jgi:hypothetical protein